MCMCIPDVIVAHVCAKPVTEEAIPYERVIAQLRKNAIKILMKKKNR